MLTTVALWMAMARDRRGLVIVGVLVLVAVLAVIAWNVAP
jgi:hypothetical protein